MRTYNFLTEAIAYVLKMEPRAAEVWLSLMLGRNVEVAEVDILTQNSERDENETSTIFPDLKVIALLKGGEQQTVYCEHKWDSPCNHNQLRSYAKLAKRDQGNSIVTFVGANQEQVREARKLEPKFVHKALCWEDIYRSLEKIPNPSLMLKELLVFMATQGLNPGIPLDARGLRAIVQAPVVKRQLRRFLEKLLTESDWQFLESRYREDNAPRFPCVKDRYGKIAIEFITQGWAPSIDVGFLYDTTDHMVTFIRPDDGIDLTLRISADPVPNKVIDQVLYELGRGRDRIQKLEETQKQKYRTRVLLKGERGNTRNQWTLLIAQKCLVDVIANCDSEAKQLEAIYGCFRQWLTTLFSDPNLEKTLQSLVHSAGAIK